MNAVKKLVRDSRLYVINYVSNLYRGFKGELVVPPDELVLFDFTKPKTINNFVCISDADVGGESSVNLNISRYGRMLFHGNVDIKVPEKSLIDHSGFCSIRSKPVIGLFDKVEVTDMTYYDCVEIKYRGDGRPYFLNLQTSSMLLNEFELFQAFLFTKGGLKWEIERVPFTKFLRTYKGYLQDEQFQFDNVRTVGVSLSDKKSGPYALEIEYLKLVRIGHQPRVFQAPYFNERYQRN